MIVGEPDASTAALVQLTMLVTINVTVTASTPVSLDPNVQYLFSLLAVED